jgi:hypothetical protein
MEKANIRNLNEIKSKQPYNGDRDQHILEVNEHHRILTEKWIVPHTQKIIKDLNYVRTIVDQRIQKLEISKGLKFNSSFPIGRCHEITVEMYKEILGTSGMNSDFQGLKMIKNFIREGGFLNCFWGIDSNNYFQNAIQAGSSIINVAGDTVDLKSPQVEIYTDLESSPIKNIATIEEAAEIMEKYWGYQVYPNTLLPNIAPYFPLIYIKLFHDRKSMKNITEVGLSGIAFSSFQYRNMRNFDKHEFVKDTASYVTPFKDSRDFIFDSKVSARQLSPEIINLLEEKAGELSSVGFMGDAFKFSADPIDLEYAFLDNAIDVESTKDKNYIYNAFLENWQKMNDLGRATLFNSRDRPLLYVK